MAFTGKGISATILFEEDRCRGGGRPIEGLGDGPFGDRIVGGEVFDGFVGRDIDVDGVELDEAAGLVGRQVARQTLGEPAFGGPAPGVGTPAQRRDGLNRTAGDELGDDAPDGGVGDSEAPLAHEGSELGAAPHGEIEAQALDRLDETGWADGLAHARRLAAARLEAFPPAIKIGARLPTAHAARSLASPSAMARRHRATASRLLSASIFGVFAPRRRDAARPLRIQ